MSWMGELEISFLYSTLQGILLGPESEVLKVIFHSTFEASGDSRKVISLLWNKVSLPGGDTLG